MRTLERPRLRYSNSSSLIAPARPRSLFHPPAPIRPDRLFVPWTDPFFPRDTALCPVGPILSCAPARPGSPFHPRRPSLPGQALCPWDRSLSPGDTLSRATGSCPCPAFSAAPFARPGDPFESSQYLHPLRDDPMRPLGTSTLRPPILRSGARAKASRNPYGFIGLALPQHSPLSTRSPHFAHFTAPLFLESSVLA